MSLKGKTKDEKFMVSLYNHEEEKGPDPVCPFFLGKENGHSEKSVKTILNLLAQSNFVKKTADKKICITSKGKELVEQLVSN
jgi:hypothetical protein